MSSNFEVRFIDTSKEVKDTMIKLSKSAMRAAGKAVGKAIKENTRTRTKRLVNHVGYWARIDRTSGHPELQVGYLSWQKVKKKGKIPSQANPMWFEFGVNPHIVNIRNAKTLTDGKIDYGKSVSHPGLRGESTLRNSVFDNIDLIKEAQKEYLSLLNDTIEAAGGKIDESEEVEDA